MRRGVRESPEFEQQRAVLGYSVRQLDDAMLSLVTALHLNAELFHHVPGTPWRAHRLRTGFPMRSDTVRVFFEILDEEMVELTAIERVNEDPDDPIKW